LGRGSESLSQLAALLKSLPRFLSKKNEMGNDVRSKPELMSENAFWQ
jgi:hypothetical protein